MEKAVKYETNSGVALISLLSLKSGNALDISLITDLMEYIKQANGDNSCRVIIIKSEGEDFCKGLNFEAVFGREKKLDISLFKLFTDCLILICKSSLPVIACVEGNVMGGGVGLVAACDLVLATENVVFMLPEIITGIIPAAIAPFLLRRMTLGRLKYMTLSTRGITADEAQVFGLVDEVACEGMTATLNRQLQRLFCSSPRAIAESKLYFERLSMPDLSQQLEIAFNQISSWLEQPEAMEGIMYFTDGFSPPWFQKYRKINV